MKYPKQIITEKPYGCERTGELCNTFNYAFMQPAYIYNGEIIVYPEPMYNNSIGYTLGLTTLLTIHNGKPNCIDDMLKYEQSSEVIKS